MGIYITRNAIKLLNDITSEKGEGKIKRGGGGCQILGWMRTVCNREGGGGGGV